ncbi:unnamed protein product [Vitrella brassicaformis CCMP3155]|uniref:SHSP domain-containing protein n=2 Tax=Vitrella brassicaformis TaxID=1169539 RepID=A0A0G4EJH4_VITBC|nr:unnamed protein product [Vitrella brassicaformis CCMP3155]|eukprot:CEL96674.1 unnamed protein product [Vitrella brassicaformis CCMP3155]
MKFWEAGVLLAALHSAAAFVIPSSNTLRPSGSRRRPLERWRRSTGLSPSPRTPLADDAATDAGGDPSMPLTSLAATKRTGIFVPPDVASYALCNIEHQTTWENTEEPIWTIFEAWLPGIKQEEIDVMFIKYGDDPGPMMVINAPKNNLVKKWEYDNFSKARRRINAENRDRVQRAYRFLPWVQLSEAQVSYANGLLRVWVPYDTEEYAYVPPDDLPYFPEILDEHPAPPATPTPKPIDPDHYGQYHDLIKPYVERAKKAGKQIIRIPRTDLPPELVHLEDRGAPVYEGMRDRGTGKL